MKKLKRKFHSQRRLNSASSSVAGGSISDLHDRVVMQCDEIPFSATTTTSTSTSTATDASLDRGSNYNSFYRNSHHRSSGGGGGGCGGVRASRSSSQSTVQESAVEGLSYRQAGCVDQEALQGHRAYYVGRLVEM